MILPINVFMYKVFLVITRLHRVIFLGFTF